MTTLEQITTAAESDMAAHGRGLDDYLSANPGHSCGATEAYLEALCSQIRMRQTRERVARQITLQIN